LVGSLFQGSYTSIFITYSLRTCHSFYYKINNVKLDGKEATFLKVAHGMDEQNLLS
jgi:hypothetical protein